MDLFEYQARDVFERHGVPVLQGLTADTPAEAEAAAAKIGGTVVVKAQVKTGGRGKAGGVKLAHNPAEAKAAAEKILGLDIKGHVVKRVMIAQGAAIDKEYYFSVLLDRSNRTFLSLCSVEGGMEIEQLAEERPEALAKIPVDASKGIANGLDVILGDPQVKSVFVNVFGGITACDAVANGIVGALNTLGASATKPLVVRLDGNNVNEGRRILADYNHPLVTVVATMDDAADKAAELANR